MALRKPIQRLQLKRAKLLLGETRVKEESLHKLLAAPMGCALIFALLVTGCGDAGNGAVAKADFVKQANRICAKSTKKMAKEIGAAYNSPDLFDANTEAEAIEFEVSTLVPILVDGAEVQLGGIGALGSPSGDEARVEAILGAYRRWASKAKVTPLKVVVANDVYNKARELAGGYGLAECEKSPFEGA